jgi:hypothetical protein
MGVQFIQAICNKVILNTAILAIAQLLTVTALQSTTHKL